MTKAFTDIDGEALDALIERVKEAKEHDLALSPDDCQLLLDALVTLATLQERLADKDVTLLKMRKLLGIVKSSEKLSDLLKKGESKPKKSKRNHRSQNDKPTAAPVKPEVKKHQLEEVSKGDTCPECGKGKLYKYEPASFLRITGQSPFIPEQHIMERVRCNACGAFFTAKVPDEVVADGEPSQKYGYSARTLMAISKFFAGTPYYRQGSIQSLLGVSLTASTIFDQTEAVANAVHPVYKVMVMMAANAMHFHIDDTTNRILEQQPVLKKVRNSKRVKERSGVYTSGLIAILAEGQKIILFETNVGHAGEFIDDVLYHRDVPDPPLLMSDALSGNMPSKQYTVRPTLCNSHARRQFVDVISHFPDEVEWFLDHYGKIWTHDREADALTPGERLTYHQARSWPIMEELRAWGEEKLSSGEVEANSGLGKAIAYFNKHYPELTAFCREEGAQLDNNLIEQQLKLVVRNRKNAMFHKTLAGAAIGDIITSMIATTSWAGVNVFDYFNTLQRRQEEVKAAPEKFLPWNYQQNCI